LKPKIFYVNKLPGKFRGMTIPPIGIFILKKYEFDDKVLEHDLVHWKQYKRMGLFLFYFRYLMQYILIGYDLMPMEMEARQNENLEDQYNYREKYHK